MSDPNPGQLKRNQTFSPKREPLSGSASLRRHVSRTTGPFSFLNPTRAYYSHVDLNKDEESAPGSEDPDANGEGEDTNRGTQDLKIPPHERAADKVQYVWSSRNNRKGRHQLEVTPAADPTSAKYLVPDRTNSLRAILQNIGRMFTKYPVWDVSWLVAYIFTWGSIVWVINAFFVWLPLVRPSTEFNDEILTGGGITAFIGATIFEIGSFFLMFEAVNENRTGCFGWAVEQVLNPDTPHKGPWLRVKPNVEGCKHHHQNRTNLVGRSRKRKAAKGAERQGGGPAQSGSAQLDQEWREDRMHNGPDGSAWVWFPPWNDLREHYLHQIGFVACTAQLFGASVFWISGFTALPGILNKLSPAAVNGAYWVPQVIGGSGFIISGTLFMIETQEKWWKPNFGVLGWHIGFWNLVGGVGFTLCPCFGFDTSSWAQYEASLSTFWGSWAFLIGSVIQLYESLQKNPVNMRDIQGAVVGRGMVLPDQENGDRTANGDDEDSDDVKGGGVNGSASEDNVIH